MNWVGNKKKYVDLVRKRLPPAWDRQHSTYIDPFVGGGALFFSLQPDAAVINDNQPHLMSIYEALRTDLEAFVENLQPLYQGNCRRVFDEQKDHVFHETCLYKKAAAFSYLIHTALFSFLCPTIDGNAYVGCYRQREVDKPLQVPRKKFAHYAACLQKPHVALMCGDFKDATRLAKPGDFIFIDPPYMNEKRPKRKIYCDFSRDDHMRLLQEVARLDALGCYVMLFNHDHPVVLEASKGWSRCHIEYLSAAGSGANNKFGNYKEILLTNYPYASTP